MFASQNFNVRCISDKISHQKLMNFSSVDYSKSLDGRLKHVERL